MEHLEANSKVGRTIRELNLNYKENAVIIFSGTKRECYVVEAALRPKKNCGWNVAEGGETNSFSRAIAANPEKKSRKELRQARVAEVDWKISYDITAPRGKKYSVEGFVAKFSTKAKAEKFIANKVKRGYHKEEAN